MSLSSADDESTGMPLSPRQNAPVLPERNRPVTGAPSCAKRSTIAGMTLSGCAVIAPSTKLPAVALVTEHRAARIDLVGNGHQVLGGRCEVHVHPQRHQL